MRPTLYLEQRVGLARKVLNECSIPFQNALPPSMQDKFSLLVRDLMTVLDGDPFGDATKRLKEMTK